MQGLILRLAHLDASAESAVRVIAFFDALAEQRANLDQVLKSAAALAGCTVGIRSTKLPDGLRMGADGALAARKPRSSRRELAPGGEVWLERDDGPLPQDEILLERLAIAYVSLMTAGGAGLPRLGDPALIELVVSGEAGVAERGRALSLLGFNSDSTVQVGYVIGPLGATLDVLRARPNLVRHAVLGGGTVLLVAEGLPEMVAFETGSRIGIGLARPALDAPTSWAGAQDAVKFAAPAFGPGDSAEFAPPSIVWWSDLGPLALLPGRITAAEINGLSDVRALDGLAAAAGEGIVRTVYAYCASGSLRQAAAALRLHHNSVASRVARAEQCLGFSLNTGTGRTRLSLALALRRLRDNSTADCL